MATTILARGRARRPAWATAAPRTSLRRLADRVLTACGCPDADLSVVLTDDDEIRALNRAWRGIDRATDVLSFPQQALRPGQRPGRLGPGPALLGDVVISLETAARRARRGLARELEFLLVHGVLHLLGHDHVRAGERRRMRAQERRVARALLGPGGAGR